MSSILRTAKFWVNGRKLNSLFGFKISSNSSASSSAEMSNGRRAVVMSTTLSSTSGTVKVSANVPPVAVMRIVWTLFRPGSITPSLSVVMVRLAIAVSAPSAKTSAAAPRPVTGSPAPAVTPLPGAGVIANAQVNRLAPAPEVICRRSPGEVASKSSSASINACKALAMVSRSSGVPKPSASSTVWLKSMPFRVTVQTSPMAAVPVSNSSSDRRASSVVTSANSSSGMFTPAESSMNVIV